MAARIFFLAVLTTAAAALLSPILANPSARTAATPQNSNTEFIRRSCQSTLYPSLCYASIARYAGTIGRDPILLALTASNVTLTHVRAVYSYVSALDRSAAANAGAMDERTKSALRDCVETLNDATDLIHRSAEEIGMLPSPEGAEVAWRVSNAQTWLSGAISSEETCVDGFQGAGERSVEEEVRRRVEMAEHYTSNALALVNGLVKGRR